MPKVVGVNFERNPKTYYFEALEFEYTENSSVLVETSRGLEYGKVTLLPFDISESQIVPPLRPVIRLATDADNAQAAKLEVKRHEALKTAQEKVSKSGLEMKLVDAEYTFDESKLIFYFTADARVDFRDLVRDLASAFKVRIELRQIGSRDECKLKGGLGPCGRACCCNAYLSDFAHVTIRMAKNQNLSLNPGKISGLCGRLMCCLAYENAHYQETNKRMPKLGSEVETTGGKKGTVVSLNQLKEAVTLRIVEKEINVYEEYKLEEIIQKNKRAVEVEKDEDTDE